MGGVCYVPSMPNRQGADPTESTRDSNHGGYMSITLEPGSELGQETTPVATVECGIPHLWLPDLGANDHTLGELAAALTVLAVDFGSAVLDDLDCDASGGYVAFRAPTPRPASL